MDRQRIEGGLIRELAGEPIGSRHLEGEGTADQTEGRVRSGAGKARSSTKSRPEKTNGGHAAVPIERWTQCARS